MTESNDNSQSIYPLCPPPSPFDPNWQLIDPYSWGYCNQNNMNYMFPIYYGYPASPMMFNPYLNNQINYMGNMIENLPNSKDIVPNETKSDIEDNGCLSLSESLEKVNDTFSKLSLKLSELNFNNKRTEDDDAKQLLSDDGSSSEDEKDCEKLYSSKSGLIPSVPSVIGINITGTTDENSSSSENEEEDDYEEEVTEDECDEDTDNEEVDVDSSRCSNDDDDSIETDLIRGTYNGRSDIVPHQLSVILEVSEMGGCPTPAQFERKLSSASTLSDCSTTIGMDEDQEIGNVNPNSKFNNAEYSDDENSVTVSLSFKLPSSSSSCNKPTKNSTISPSSNMHSGTTINNEISVTLTIPSRGNSMDRVSQISKSPSIDVSSAQTSEYEDESDSEVSVSISLPLKNRKSNLCEIQEEPKTAKQCEIDENETEYETEYEIEEIYEEIIDNVDDLNSMDLAAYNCAMEKMKNSLDGETKNDLKPLSTVKVQKMPEIKINTTSSVKTDDNKLLELSVSNTLTSCYEIEEYEEEILESDIANDFKRFDPMKNSEIYIENKKQHLLLEEENNGEIDIWSERNDDDWDNKTPSNISSSKHDEHVVNTKSNHVSLDEDTDSTKTNGSQYENEEETEQNQIEKAKFEQIPLHNNSEPLPFKLININANLNHKSQLETFSTNVHNKTPISFSEYKSKQKSKEIVAPILNITPIFTENTESIEYTTSTDQECSKPKQLPIALKDTNVLSESPKPISNNIENQDSIDILNKSTRVDENEIKILIQDRIAIFENPQKLNKNTSSNKTNQLESNHKTNNKEINSSSSTHSALSNGISKKVYVEKPKIVEEVRHPSLSRHSSSQRSSQEDSEVDEDDSGVTSDMSRHISETDTESECFPELRKMTRYQRAATHSRLFKLLQDECDLNSDDNEVKVEEKPKTKSLSSRNKKIVHNVSITRKQNPDAIKEAETMTARRERLNLPLKSNCSIDCDSLSSSGSSPTSNVVTEKLVNELVQSLLLKKKSRYLRELPLEKLQAYAKRVLTEDMENSSHDTFSSSDDVQPNVNRCSPAMIVDKSDDSYQKYYDSWDNFDESKTIFEIIPSKAFKNLQDQQAGYKKQWAARCPRVLSSKTINRDLSRVTEIRESVSPDPSRSFSPSVNSMK